MLKKINTYCEICNKKLTKRNININTKKDTFNTNILNCYNSNCEIGLKNLYVKKNSKKINIELNNIVKKILKDVV